MPATTVAELVAYAKAQSGKLNFASSGPGSSLHFAGELFKLMTGTDMTHIAYRGSAPALTDLLAGNVDLVFDNLPVVWPQVQQGNLRALGVASLDPLAAGARGSRHRRDAAGIRGGVLGRHRRAAGTPPVIVDKISQAFGAAVVRPDIGARFKELGYTPARNTPAEFTQFIRDDRARWQRVAREAKLSAQ